jgi:hypothetical protein
LEQRDISDLYIIKRGKIMGFITDITAAIPNTGIYINGYPSGVDNDQGNIRAGGTIAETDLWTSSSLGEEERLVLISSGVNNTGVIAPSTPSTFNNQPGQVIVKYTTDIAGVTNLTQAIRSAGSSGIYSINQLDVMESINYKTSVVAGNWNVFSGAFSPALTVTDAGGWDIGANGIGVDNSSNLRGSGTDTAANPTPAIPGRLTYMYGAFLPSGATYSAKTNW